MNLKPYPKYKDSGVAWLGEIPEHWGVRKFKQGTKFVSGGTPSKSSEEFWQGAIPWVSPKDMKRVYLDDAQDHISKEAIAVSATALLPTNSLLLVVRSGILRHSIPVAVNRAEVAINQDIKGIIPDENVFAARYLMHLISGNQNSFLLEWRKYGATVESLEHELIANSLLPRPFTEEQVQIANYLDSFNLKVQLFIRNKLRLIELLKEQKQNIINRAVTRGLNPDVKLKPSGVEWLGDVPEHWEVVRLKNISHIRYGLGQPPKELKGGTPMIRATNVERGKIVEKGMIYVDPANVPIERSPYLSAGEIIVVRSGAYTADSAIVPSKYEGAIAGYDMVVSVTKAIPQFIANVLLSKYALIDQLFLLRSRAAQPHLNAEELGGISIFVPPRFEQERINNFIAQKVEEIHKTISRTEREIELIREYRTRLISDVVTGKVDVRDIPVEDVEEEELVEVALEAEEEVVGT